VIYKDGNIISLFLFFKVKRKRVKITNIFLYYKSVSIYRAAMNYKQKYIKEIRQLQKVSMGSKQQCWEGLI
jgi:hypothetical protein